MHIGKGNRSVRKDDDFAEEQEDSEITDSPTNSHDDDLQETNNTKLNPNRRKSVCKYSVKMFVQYSREFLCLLALILTTLATLQNRSQKVARPPIPIPIFAKESRVQEWSNGNLNVVQNIVSLSEMSLIYFYAPWCAESQTAKVAYEEVSQFYDKEIYFAAINCWQPGGECRIYYSKVHRWPVLMAYLPRGLAVQYNGDWSFKTLSKFIEGLQRPIQRIHNQRDLLKLRINQDVVVLGVFETINCKKYQIFFQTAVKWLESDSEQKVKFAVYSGALAKEFNATILPGIQLYTWNKSIEFPSQQWSVEEITKWTKKKSDKESIWITLPNTKSSTVAGYLTKGPSLLMFAPKNNINENNNHYLILKQIAYTYRNCKNDSNISNIAKNIPLVRKDNLHKMKQFNTFCTENMVRNDVQSSDNRCTLDSKRRSQFPALNSTNENQGNSDNSFCKKHTDAIPCAETENPVNFMSCSSSRNGFVDYRTPKAILKNLIAKECRKLLREHEYYVNHLNESATDMKPKRGEFHCKYNRTLSFHMLDTTIQNDYLSKFVGNNDIISSSAVSVFIVDNENENSFMLKKPITFNSIGTFIEEFYQNALRRQLRSSRIAQNPAERNMIQIKEINSLDFTKLTKWRNSTQVILFYSPQCALCNIMSQTLLHIAKMMNSVDINFFRINGESNDLHWEYSMEHFPTLLIFPKNKTAETRAFPPSMRVNQKNILGFILANLSRRDQLKVLFNSCMLEKLNVSFLNCVKHLRRKISDEISHHLNLWLRHINHRSKTYERLTTFKGIYDILLRAKNACDLQLLLKDISIVNLS